MLSAGLGYGAPGSGTTPPYSPPPPRHSPLPSFGFTQEQVACVCEVSQFKTKTLFESDYEYLETMAKSPTILPSY